MKEKFELEGNCQRKTKQIEKMVERVKFLEKQIHDIQEQHLKDTQVLTYYFFCLALLKSTFPVYHWLQNWHIN